MSFKQNLDSHKIKGVFLVKACDVHVVWCTRMIHGAYNWSKEYNAWMYCIRLTCGIIFARSMVHVFGVRCMQMESGTLAWNNVHAYAHWEWHNLREHVACVAMSPNKFLLILPSKLILKPNGVESLRSIILHGKLEWILWIQKSKSPEVNKISLNLPPIPLSEGTILSSPLLTWAVTVTDSDKNCLYNILGCHCHRHCHCEIFSKSLSLSLSLRNFFKVTVTVTVTAKFFLGHCYCHCHCKIFSWSLSLSLSPVTGSAVTRHCSLQKPLVPVINHEIVYFVN